MLFRALLILSAVCLALLLVDGDDRNTNKDDTDEDVADIDEVGGDEDGEEWR